MSESLDKEGGEDMKLYAHLLQQELLRKKAAGLVVALPSLGPISNEECQQLKAKWAVARKEQHCREIKYRYCQRNRGKLSMKTQAWRRQNPGKVKEYYHVRRARKLKVLGRFTGPEWIALCIKYEHRCVACCRVNVPLTADHVVSLLMGGSNHISNIQPLCGSCNSSKGAKTIDYRGSFEERMAVRVKQ